MSIRELWATLRAGTRCARLSSWLLLGVASAHSATVYAQLGAPDGELSALRSAVEQARFEDAEAGARALLARADLSAQQRNDALELLAIAQVARRNEYAAHATASELFRRDPEHRERVRDPGPSVEAVFARTRVEAQTPLLVGLATSTLALDAFGRALLHVSVGVGRDAVDSVHVFSRVAPEREYSHVVADAGLREQLAIALPVPREPSEPGAEMLRLELYTEARAPSGAVLARNGSADAPLAVQLQRPSPCPPPSPAPRPRGPWWLWTSLAIVVAGLSVSGAVLAH